MIAIGRDHAPNVVAAVFAAMLAMLVSPTAQAFREYVPPQCQAASDVHQYRSCLYKIMQVEPAESLQARGGIAYRLLNITDSPAMPLFVEFARVPGQPPRLSIRSPDPTDSPFTVPVGEARWRAIQARWRSYSTRPKIKGQDMQTRESNGVETVCIPWGSMDTEVVLHREISRLSPDTCDDDEASFAMFLRSQAVAAAGACAREMSGDVPDSRKLLHCVLHHPNPN